MTAPDVTPLLDALVEQTERDGDPGLARQLANWRPSLAHPWRPIRERAVRGLRHLGDVAASQSQTTAARADELAHALAAYEHELRATPLELVLTADDLVPPERGRLTGEHDLGAATRELAGEVRLRLFDLLDEAIDPGRYPFLRSPPFEIGSPSLLADADPALTIGVGCLRADTGAITDLSCFTTHLPTWLEAGGSEIVAVACDGSVAAAFLYGAGEAGRGSSAAWPHRIVVE